MKPFQERVIDEKRELDEKIEKLKTFINDDGPTFRGLPVEEQDRMHAQLAAMTRYSDILGDRIQAFPIESVPPAVGAL